MRWKPRAENYETNTPESECKGARCFIQSNFGKDVENESQIPVIFSSVILAPMKLSGVLW